MTDAIRYRPEIDGLRAVAVVSVIAYHLNPSWIPGGFLGVDIFFVISGYLITSILLRDLALGRFSILNFYERRARRILPALLVVVLTCIPFAWLLMDATELQAFGRSLLSQVVFGSNFLFWKESGYFAAPAETVPLLHTWSLAVEEQFYLLFPAVLFLGWRYFKNYIGWVVFGLAVVSMWLAQLLISTDRSIVFYLLPFRSWELLAGAFLAFLERNEAIPSDRLLSRILAIVGGVLLATSMWTYSETTAHPSLISIPPILGACLVIRYGRTGPIAFILALRSLVGIGLISYSLYLWHWPLIAFTRLFNLGELPANSWQWIVPTCAALAWLSWKFVEQPARQIRVSAAFVTRIGSQVSVMTTAGIVMLFATPQWTYLDMTMSADDRYIYSFVESKLTRTEAYEFGECFLQGAFVEADDDCSSISHNSRSVLLWGDSHAAGLIFGMRFAIPNSAVYTTSDCGPFLGFDHPSVSYCRPNNDYVLERIKKLKPDIVLLAANWAETVSLAPFLHETIAGIKGVSHRTKVVVLGGMPQWQPSLPEVLIHQNVPLAEDARVYTNLKVVNGADTKIKEEALRNGAEFLPLTPMTCDAEACLAFGRHDENLEPFAWDYGHLSPGGSLVVAESIWRHLGEDSNHRSANGSSSTD